MWVGIRIHEAIGRCGSQFLHPITSYPHLDPTTTLDPITPHKCSSYDYCHAKGISVTDLMHLSDSDPNLNIYTFQSLCSPSFFGVEDESRESTPAHVSKQLTYLNRLVYIGTLERNG